MDKGHVIDCSKHNTVEGFNRQCVNCYQELRDTLRPSKINKGASDKASRSCPSRVTTNPKPHEGLKLKHFLRLRKLEIKAARVSLPGNRNIKTVDESGHSNATSEDIRAARKSVSQPVHGDPKWYERHTANIPI